MTASYGPTAVRVCAETETAAHKAAAQAADGQLVGLLTRGDLMKALGRPDAAELTVVKAGSQKLTVTYPDELAEEAVAMDLSDKPVAISEEYLTKIVDELIHNAFKFSKQGTPIQVSLFPSDDSLILSISDHGRSHRPPRDPPGQPAGVRRSAYTRSSTERLRWSARSLR